MPTLTTYLSRSIHACMHIHRVLCVTLPRYHPVVCGPAEISKVEFNVTANTNRLNNKVSGKRKHGAQVVSQCAPLCRVIMDNGESYTINAGVKGKLIEVNEALVKSPNLLRTKVSIFIYTSLRKIIYFSTAAQ